MDWRWIQLSQHWIWEWGVNDIYDVIGWYLYELNNNNERNGNNIGEKGKKALREGKNSKLEIDIGNIFNPVYLWMDKKLVILTRWVVLQVMKVCLWFYLFLAKVMGNWGIWRCGLKQLKGEPNRNGDKSYWKTMNNNGEKEVIYFVRKRHLSPKEKEVGWEEKNDYTKSGVPICCSCFRTSKRVK